MPSTTVTKQTKLATEETLRSTLRTKYSDRQNSHKVRAWYIDLADPSPKIQSIASDWQLIRPELTAVIEKHFSFGTKTTLMRWGITLNTSYLSIIIGYSKMDAGAVLSELKELHENVAEAFERCDLLGRFRLEFVGNRYWHPDLIWDLAWGFD